MTFESTEPYTEPPKPDSSSASLPGYGYMENYGTARPGADLFANIDPDDALTGDLLVQKGDAWVPFEDAGDPGPGRLPGDYKIQSPADTEQLLGLKTPSDEKSELLSTDYDDPTEIVGGPDTALVPSRPNHQPEVKPETLAIAPSAETEPPFEGFEGNLTDLDKEPGPDASPKIDGQEPAKASAGDSRWAEPPDSSAPRRKPRNPLSKLMSEKPKSAGKELEISGNTPPTNEPPESPPEPPENPGVSPPTEPPNLPVKLSRPPQPIRVPSVNLELSQKYWSAKDFWLGFGRLVLGNFVVGPMAMATQKLEARGVVEESKGVFGQTTKYNVNVLNVSTGRTTKLIVKGDTPNDAANKATTEADYRFAAIMKTI